MHHIPPTQLVWPAGSIAHFSREPSDRLLVFVHGFRGNATRTWTGAAAIFESGDKLRSTDVVFYGYSSVARAALSASLFREFLHDAANRGRLWSDSYLCATGRIPPDLPYREIVIVAHSLGAAVVRRAILDAIELEQTWPSRTKLILFAPAHLGSNVMRLVGSTAGTVGSILANLFALANLRMPVLADLEYESAFIRALVDETRKLLADGWSTPLKAAQVVFGQHENVVEVARFCADPVPTVWTGEDHLTICKIPRTSDAVVQQL